MPINYPAKVMKTINPETDESPLIKLHPRTALHKKMTEYGLSSAALAVCLNVPTNRITEIMSIRRRVTASTALRLAIYFGTTAKYWLDMQTAYEIALAESEEGETLRRTITPRAKA